MKQSEMYIPFSFIKENLYNKVDDTHFLVWTGFLFNDEDIPEIEKFFVETTHLCGEGTKIKNINPISGNVLGDKGRHDVLIELEGPGVTNVIVRLAIDGLKWLSDFVDNFKGDYEEC